MPFIRWSSRLIEDDKDACYLIVPPLRLNGSALSRPSIMDNETHPPRIFYPYTNSTRSEDFFFLRVIAQWNNLHSSIFYRISLCGRQEEFAGYSWSAALYKLYTKVFPESVHLLGIPLFCVLIYMECDKAKILVLMSVWCHGNHVNAHASGATIIIHSHVIFIILSNDVLAII